MSMDNKMKQKLAEAGVVIPSEDQTIIQAIKDACKTRGWRYGTCTGQAHDDWATVADGDTVHGSMPWCFVRAYLNAVEEAARPKWKPGDEAYIKVIIRKPALMGNCLISSEGLNMYVLTKALIPIDKPQEVE